MAATTAELNSIPKEGFRHASNNGGTTGRIVWSPKGTTLRVIRCPMLQVSQFLFPGQRSDLVSAQVTNTCLPAGECPNKTPIFISGVTPVPSWPGCGHLAPAV